MNGVVGLAVVAFMALFVLVIAMAILNAKRAKARRQAFSATAARHGWGYSVDDSRWTQYFEGAPFGTGHNLSAKNVLTGRYRERDFVAFDYCYYTTETSTNSNGHSSSREVPHHFGVVAMQTGVVFPPLTVSPEGFFSRLAGRISGRDIELESEVFNRAFTVVCTDRKFASDILHPRQMEFLLAHPDHTFRFSGPWVLTIDAGQFELPELMDRLNYLSTLIAQVPDFIWKEARS